MNAPPAGVREYVLAAAFGVGVALLTGVVLAVLSLLTALGILGAIVGFHSPTDVAWLLPGDKFLTAVVLAMTLGLIVYLPRVGRPKTRGVSRVFAVVVALLVGPVPFALFMSATDAPPASAKP